MNVATLTELSVALQLPPSRNTLVRHMLDGAAQDLRGRGIAWTVIDAVADITFRLGRSEDGESAAGLYADFRHPQRGASTLRVDGPLRTAAITGLMSRVVRELRSEDTAQGADQALRFLERWDVLAPGDHPITFSIGDRPVALLDPQRALWCALDWTASVDAEHLVERMARDGFSLQLADAALSTRADGVALKPLLWQLGLIAGAAGRLRILGPREGLRLKGWPWLAAGGAKAFTALIGELRGADVTATTIDAAGRASAVERDGFLNACYVCGFLEVLPPPSGSGVVHAQRRLAADAANARRISTRGATPGRVGRVLSSIRRTLGMTAG